MQNLISILGLKKKHVEAVGNWAEHSVTGRRPHEPSRQVEAQGAAWQLPPQWLFRMRDRGSGTGGDRTWLAACIQVPGALPGSTPGEKGTSWERGLSALGPAAASLWEHARHFLSLTPSS